MENFQRTPRDRRVRRSSDLAMALNYLLASQRERAGLGALLLSTYDGVLLAYDGDRDDCEELAAYAPFIARGQGFAIDPRRLQGVAVHTFHACGQEIHLMLRGDAPAERLDSTVLASIEGALRILAF